MKREIKDAIALLDAAGYAIAKRQGQSVIQIVRRRILADDPFWRYHVNKYEKRYTAKTGEEIESVILPLNDLKWVPAFQEPEQPV